MYTKEKSNTMDYKELNSVFIETVESLQFELNEGDIDVHKFYEEIVLLKDYMKQIKSNNTKAVIAQLKSMDIDGETMQHILEEVGMEWQMLRQLILTSSTEQVEYLLEEKKDLGL